MYKFILRLLWHGILNLFQIALVTGGPLDILSKLRPGGSVEWSIAPYTKGCGFKPRSRHIPRLCVQFPVGVYTGGKGWMLLSHVGVPLSLSPPAPVPLSFTAINIASREDFKNSGLSSVQGLIICIKTERKLKIRANR